MDLSHSPNFASIWFNLFDIETVYFKTSMEYTRFINIINIIAEHYDVHISDIFNSTFYDSYFGNIVHSLIHKIYTNTVILGEPGSIEFNQKVYPIIHFLFKIINLGYVDNLQKNYYGSTPFDELGFYKLNTNIFAFKVLSMVLDTRHTNIIVVCQSCIRRWLAIRYVKKKLYMRALDDILYSPPGQIGLHIFPSFVGGVGYISSMGDFRHRSIQQLVDICVT